MQDARFQSLSPQEKEWVEAYVNGTIESESFEALQARMLESPALRAAMRRYLALDGYLQDENAAPMPDTLPWIEAERAQESPATRTRPIWPSALWPATVAALLAVAAGIVVSTLRDGGEAATITGMDGPVRWTGGDGRIRDDLTIGAALNGGMLEAQLPSAWVEFAFRDGSKVTVSGLSVLTLSAHRQKNLHLRQGSLSAQVVPQPEGFPLLVHTPAAELQVLGTQLNVEAAATSTRLVVNEGRVRLKRLVDGTATEVPAGYEATASVEDEMDLGISRQKPARSLWKSKLPEDIVRGEWLWDLEELAKRLKASVRNGALTEQEAVAKYKQAAILRETDGRLRTSPILIGGKKLSGIGPKLDLIVLTVSRGQPQPVHLAAGAVFRIRGQVPSAAEVSFGFTAHRPGGGFAGKYETTRRITRPETEGAAFHIEMPLEQFRANDAKFAASPAGLELTEWWCFTEDANAELEIIEVELTVP